MTTTAKVPGSRGEHRKPDGMSEGEVATRRWFPDEIEFERWIDAIVGEVEKRRTEDAKELLFPVDSGASPVHRHRSVPSLSEIASSAYLSMFQAMPEDHVIINPEANSEFISRCRLRGASVSEFLLNKALLNLRKCGRHRGIERGGVLSLEREVFDKVGFAAEMAARLVQMRAIQSGAEQPTVDKILCDPILREQFDNAVQSVAPGFSVYEYRLGAFSYRKSGRESTVRLGQTSAPAWEVTDASFRTLDPDDAPMAPGVYRIDAGSRAVFVSATLNLRSRLLAHLAAGDRQSLFPQNLWDTPKGELSVRWFSAPEAWRPRLADAVAQRIKLEEKSMYNLYSCCA